MPKLAIAIDRFLIVEIEAKQRTARRFIRGERSPQDPAARSVGADRSADLVATRR